MVNGGISLPSSDQNHQRLRVYLHYNMFRLSLQFCPPCIPHFSKYSDSYSENLSAKIHEDIHVRVKKTAFPVHTWKHTGGATIRLQYFLTSVLVRSEWLPSRPGLFTPGKEPRYSLNTRVGPWARLDILEKRNLSDPYRERVCDQL
jgi:hypothetical protein